MSLTTPVIRDEDHVFPGENWFFYWKTSASLWERKLRTLDGVKKVYIPINWSFHSETGDRYDFAKEKPESDIARLCEAIHNVGKTPVILFPLSPCPFLPNGGVPSLLARVQSVDEEGKVIAAIDHENTLHKMYSFFDTRVYKAYSKFTQSFGDYLSTSGINADVVGLECGTSTDSGFESYFDDRSSVYEEGFSRFLQSEHEGALPSVEEERKLHKKFRETIYGIYLEQLDLHCNAYMEGALKVSFLGGAPVDFFRRIHGQDSLVKYAHDLFESLSMDVAASSILLPAKHTQGLLAKMLDSFVTKSFMETSLSDINVDEQGSAHFRLKKYFEIYDIDHEVYSEALGWADLSLWEYLQRSYTWCYSDLGSKTFSFDEERDYDRVLFFHGLSVNEAIFRDLLRAFMSGARVVLNRSGLKPELLKRLEAFFIENNLKVEKVSFHTLVYNVSLGDGRLVVFEGDKLADLDSKKAFQFWEKLLFTFDLNHLQVNSDPDLYSVWSMRNTSHGELSYNEVRRLSLFNPTSYKKTLRFVMPKEFKLLKIMDENQVSYEHGPSEISIQFLPGGSVSFDFGVLS